MKKLIVGVVMFAAVSVTGIALAQASHIDMAISNLKTSINEAIQCGGGGKDGAGCKGARAEAIALMRQALAKLEAAKKGQ